MVFSKEDRINGLIAFLKGGKETVSKEEEKNMREFAELFEDEGGSVLSQKDIENCLKSLNDYEGEQERNEKTTSKNESQIDDEEPFREFLGISGMGCVVSQKEIERLLKDLESSER